MSEKEFINNLVPNYITSSQSSQTRLMRDLIIRTFSPYIKGGVALELGCEVGYMSKRLASLFEQLDIIDGSDDFIKKVGEMKLGNVSLINNLFENLTVIDKYDYVVASHVLEHVQNVQDILERINNSLKSGGILFVSVPNARAMSRQLARCMGLVDDLYALTQNDIRGGHRRVYDQQTLEKEVRLGKFSIIKSGGIFLKPLADFQMDKVIDAGIIGKEQQEGLFRLGEDYPDMCADIYIIAQKW